MIKWKKSILELNDVDLPIVDNLIKKYNHKKIIKMNYNENAFGPTHNLSNLEDVMQPHRYPPFMYEKLRNILSIKYGLPADFFYISSGSDFILSSLPNLFQNGEVIIPELTFARIELTCQMYNLKTIKVNLKNGKMDLEGILSKINSKTCLIYLVNPNMPTGGHCTFKEINNFIDKVPNNVVVVLDEAYGEFAVGIQNTFKNNEMLIRKYKNLIVTHTFSKVFGLANFRIGYAVADSSIIKIFQKALLPFLVSEHSIDAALIALDDLQYYNDVIQKINNEKLYLYTEFDKLKLKYIRSYGNFIFIYAKKFNNEDIYNYLLMNFGILIRCIRNIGLRITIGLHEENQLLIQGMKDYFNVKS